MPLTWNRRQFLRASATAAAALPCVAGSSSAAEPAASPTTGLTIGIATLGFANYTNSQLAKELSEQGIRTVQLFLSQSDSRYWKYNGRSDVSDLTAERCQAIAGAYREAGISIHSIGVYTNLIHPDEAERKANLDYFEAMMKIARAMGVRMLITEAGHFRSDEPEPPVPHHFQEDVWKTMVATGKELARRAEAHDAVVLCEPFFRGFLASAKRTRLFLEEVDSPRVKALLDPANLIEINDLDEMFQQLQPWIECLHAKDRKLHVDRGVPAGQGDLDYERFVTLAAQRTPHAPLILEYVGPQDYQQARAHLETAIRKAGGAVKKDA
ncbi:MAG TPA: sugar phosphate isomerase/epimerase family protein [Candidatus Anammoximicrobium sp.]|nr:sugar phosphate isomerase/epimerase family protein [Candidatus Anammoximicrobium sp.]